MRVNADKTVGLLYGRDSKTKPSSLLWTLWFLMITWALNTSFPLKVRKTGCLKLLMTLKFLASSSEFCWGTDSMYVHANPIKVGESRKHVSEAEWDPLLSSQCKLTAGSGRNVKKQNLFTGPHWYARDLLVRERCVIWSECLLHAAGSFQ